VTRILAYSIAFMIVIQVMEWAIFQPLERHAARWRQ
jgi:NitT/TauT family transport system permease protein